MLLNELIDALYPLGSPKRPTPEQDRILHHASGPAWVLAGPGSGKTEVLTLQVLRLLYVEGDSVQQHCVRPESVFVTTFTDKAARSLKERISRYRERLVVACPTLPSVDLSKVRIGTLHGLANDILQEARAANYRNVRLMDELETAMFVHENMSIVRSADKVTDTPFWTHFAFMFAPKEWQPHFKRLPLEWDMTRVLSTLFNRICDDRKSLQGMRTAGGQLSRLADLYEEYQRHLLDAHRCDFAQLQQRFLDFLTSAEGQRLRDGVSGDLDLPGITHILVDEYQDTNLIQEAIYLELARRSPHNLTVVGDDDQAMYRFRGGSVECMVTFDEACATLLGVPRSSVSKYPLVGNFRSHEDIVAFCNKFVTSFPSMALPGARAPGKLPLVAKSKISGEYQAVGTLTSGKAGDLGRVVAEAIRDLKAAGVIADYSQACILLESTRESARNAGPYADALRKLSIPVHNPRSRTFLDQPEVAGLLGCLLLVLDPDAASQPNWAPDELPDQLNEFRSTALAIKAKYGPLKDYVDRVRSNLAQNAGTFLDATLQEVAYYLLSLPPFADWMNDPVSRKRLGHLTKLIESYAALPVQGKVKVSRGNLRSDASGTGSVHFAWLRTFYGRFFGYLSKGGVNDLEDSDDITPQGCVSIMTMHQAKGLEFPFVFVGHLGTKSSPDTTHYLEDLLATVANTSGRSFKSLSLAQRAELDTIRKYYVAYSRAEHALILVGSKSQMKAGGTPCGPTTTWLQQHVLEL